MVKILVVSLPSAFQSAVVLRQNRVHGERDFERKIWLNKQIILPLQPASKKYSSSTSFLVASAEINLRKRTEKFGRNL